MKLYSMNMLFLLILVFGSFILGNFIYTTDVLLIFKILVSELSFIFLYTIVDKGNIKFKTPFTILSILVVGQFLLPIYGFLFYSKSVQLFSITISVITTFINSLLVRNLIYRGLSKIISSRISTTIASAIEICLFAFLLNIGIQGALYTTVVRIIYIYIIPRIIFSIDRSI